jgi:hypothetical protein
MRKGMLIFTIFTMVWLTTACYGTVEWYESFRFKGRIEEIIVDGKMLVLKEFDASAGSKYGNIYLHKRNPLHVSHRSLF